MLSRFLVTVCKMCRSNKENVNCLVFLTLFCINTFFFLFSFPLCLVSFTGSQGAMGRGPTSGTSDLSSSCRLSATETSPQEPRTTLGLKMVAAGRVQTCCTHLSTRWWRRAVCRDAAHTSVQDGGGGPCADTLHTPQYKMVAAGRVVWKGFPAFPAHLRMRPVARGNSRRATWAQGTKKVQGGLARAASTPAPAPRAASWPPVPPGPAA